MPPIAWLEAEPLARKKLSDRKGRAFPHIRRHSRDKVERGEMWGRSDSRFGLIGLASPKLRRSATLFHR
jgi:hypothetical protein